MNRRPQVPKARTSYERRKRISAFGFITPPLLAPYIEMKTRVKVFYTIPNFSTACTLVFACTRVLDRAHGRISRTSAI